VEHQFTPQMMFRIGYVGSESIHQPEEVSTNDATPGPGTLASRRPFPALGGVDNNWGDGNNSVQGLEASFERRPGREGLTLIAAFSKIKSIDNYQARLSEPGDKNEERSWLMSLKQNRGLGPGNLPQRFSLGGEYRLPFGAGKPYVTTGPGAKALGGWALEAMFVGEGGPWDNVIFSYDFAGIGTSNSQRPNRIGNPNMPRSQRTRAEWFNTADFVNPPAGTFGNASRGDVQGPDLSILNLGIHRSFRITESAKVDFRVESFNLPNHTNFKQPLLKYGAASFGAETSALSARQIQFGLKIYY
jgi:hypothetical protein